MFNEEQRQNNQIELIASENFVMRLEELCGSVFTNKYAEGYPGARYYNGCDYMDALEWYAKISSRLYGCSYSNVQPHSGVNANTAVSSLLKPGIKYWVWILL